MGLPEIDRLQGIAMPASSRGNRRPVTAINSIVGLAFTLRADQAGTFGRELKKTRKNKQQEAQLLRPHLFCLSALH